MTTSRHPGRPGRSRAVDGRTGPDGLPASRPVLAVRGPGDLLGAVPYLVGFHPESSLVLVGLHGTHLVVTVRMDLLDLVEPSVLADAVAAMRRGGAGEVVAIVYDDDPGPGDPARLPWDGVADVVADACTAEGCAVLEVLLVSGGRWWSYICAEPDCCPPEGRPLPTGTSAFAAAATVAGMAVLPDRAAMVAQLRPRPDAERDRLRPLISQCEDDAVGAVLDGAVARRERSLTRALFAAARAADELTDRPADPVDDATAARLAVALGGVSVRDSVWMGIDDGRLDGRTLWRDLAARVPAPYDAAPLFLFGWKSWRAGNSALAGVAVERALASDPTYSAADLLLAALNRGVDPRQLPRLRLPRPA